MRDRDGLFQKLKPKQKELLLALLAGSKLTQAAKDLDVPIDTVRSWYHDKDFQAVLDRESSFLYRITFNRLVDLNSKAIDRLAAMLHDPNASDKTVLRAIELCLSHASNYRKILWQEWNEDINLRLQTLEQAATNDQKD